MILHVFNGLWAEIDEFSMLAWNMNGWLVMNVGMELVYMIILCLVDETCIWCGLGRNSMNL